MEHAGHRGEVPGLVVVLSVLPEGLQQGDAPRSEQAEGADDHQHHGQEEQLQGIHGVFRRDGKIIPRPSGDEPQNGQQPLGFRLPLPRLAALQKLDGLHPPKAKQIQKVGEQKDDPEARAGVQHRVPWHLEAKSHVHPHDGAEEEQEELRKQDAQQEPAQDTDEGRIDGLPEEEPGKVPLLHAQDVVEAQLLLPPLHKEAVGVADECEGEQGHDEGAEAQQPLDGVGPLQSGHAGVHVEEQDVVEQPAADQQVHDVHALLRHLLAAEAGGGHGGLVPLPGEQRPGG